MVENLPCNGGDVGFVGKTWIPCAEKQLSLCAATSRDHVLRSPGTTPREST